MRRRGNANARHFFAARTSGIVLIAGVGSYCAYRICARFLGKEFVWTMLDAARPDRLRLADSRLLHPAAGADFLLTRAQPTACEQRARHRLTQLLNATIAENEGEDGGARSSVAPPSSVGGSQSAADGPRHRLIARQSGSPIRVVRGANPLFRRALHQQAASVEPRASSSGLAIRRLRSLNDGGAEANAAVTTRASLLVAADDDFASCE